MLPAVDHFFKQQLPFTIHGNTRGRAMTLEREAHSTGRNAVTPAAGHRQTATLAPVPEKERAESAPPAATQPPGVRTPTGDSALQPGQGGEASRSDAALSPAPSPAPAPLDPRLAAAAKDADDFWNDTGPDKVDSPTQKEPEPDGFIRRSRRKSPPPVHTVRSALAFSSARPAELGLSFVVVGQILLDRRNVRRDRHAGGAKPVSQALRRRHAQGDGLHLLMRDACGALCYCDAFAIRL